MATPDASSITVLLHAWKAGDGIALEQLMPLVYRELHRTAKRYIAGERPDHTFQSGDLVNEVYLRLLRMKQITWQDRGHFYAACTYLMRQILIDSARASLARKRGGKRQSIPLDEAVMAVDGPDSLLVLDRALRDLAALDLRKSKALELRIFGGFSVVETAQILGVSEDTITRDCQFAKLWLFRQLNGSKAHA